MSKSLKAKTIKGLSWSMADNLANQGIMFLVGIVLARLLSPQEYGIIGIILIFLAVFNSIVDSGFSNALIRKIDAKAMDYNTVFIINMVLSIVLFVLLFFIAPFVSRYFAIPLLKPTLRVMGSIVIINAFTIIQRTLLIKKIDFKTQTKVSVVASVVSGVIGIAMAYSQMGVWSLVAQQISRQLLNSVLLWMYNKDWTPKLEFSINSFKELFNFGWKVMAVGLIGTVWEEIYQGVIGKCYTPQTLGQFTRANQFRNIFSRNLATVVQRVSYPVLSSLQGNNDNLRESFRRIVKMTFFVSSVCMLLVGAVAKSMIIVLIGEKWLTAVVFLQIICFSGLWNPMTHLNVNMLQVQGKSGLLLKLEIIKRSVAVIPILLGIYIDIIWMLWGSVGANFIIFLIDAHFAGKQINYSVLNQVRDILPSFVIALFIGGCVWMLSFIDLRPIFILMIQCFSALILFLSVGELFKNKEYVELKTIVSTFLQKQFSK